MLKLQACSELPRHLYTHICTCQRTSEEGALIRSGPIQDDWGRRSMIRKARIDHVYVKPQAEGPPNKEGKGNGLPLEDHWSAPHLKLSQVLMEGKVMDLGKLSLSILRLDQGLARIRGVVISVSLPLCQLAITFTTYASQAL